MLPGGLGLIPGVLNVSLEVLGLGASSVAAVRGAILFGMTLAELGDDLPRRYPNAGQRLDVATIRPRTPSLLISRRADTS